MSHYEAVERVAEHRVWTMTSIRANQFEFYPRKIYYGIHFHPVTGSGEA